MIMGELVTAAIIINLFATMVRLATPLLIAAMGELVTERSGVMNLGLDGMMLTGRIPFIRLLRLAPSASAKPVMNRQS